MFSVHEDGEVMLALMQKDRARHFRKGRENVSIGFQVQRVNREGQLPPPLSFKLHQHYTKQLRIVMD